jgi:hypothetical protein
MSTMLRPSICFITVCLLIGWSDLGASANDRPNVIVIMADDKCWRLIEQAAGCQENSSFS